jgi:hypothetical protein
MKKTEEKQITRQGIKSNFGILELIACAVVAYSFYLAVKYAGQPPLDRHSFRQTQTALSSYWFIQEGFKWAYETPVGGPPWSLPFEFPIYQLIVAWLSKGLGLSLDVVGRLTSYAFLFLTIFPVRSITRKLDLPDSTLTFFVAIVFSMPVYVYWGRTFMIETAALFFAVAAIQYFLDYLLGKRSLRVVFLFLLFSSLAVLQKATTGLPVLAVLLIAFIFREAKQEKNKTIHALVLNKEILKAGVLIVIPVAIGFAWVVFTDQVKMENPFGRQLTSAALSSWNWGTISQRISSDLWIKVILKRIFIFNMSCVLGVFLLIAIFFVRLESRIKAVALGAVALGIVPLFLFTNLHIVHDYYQTANLLFLAYGVAIALSLVVLPSFGKRTAIFVTVLLVASNYVMLRMDYLPWIKKVFDKQNRELMVGSILDRELPVGGQFVAFGNDWSSTFAYMAKRKSFTVPGAFKAYDQVVSNPEKFVEEGRLSGIVSCTVEHPGFSALLDWVNKSPDGTWKIGEIHGCLIVTPEKKLDATPVQSAQCNGSIEKAEIQNRDGRRVMVISGWTTTGGEKPKTPDDVFLHLQGKDGLSIDLQAMKVPRLDVYKTPGLLDDSDAGFSRIFSGNLSPGDYEIEIIHHSDQHLNSCNIKKEIHIE